MGVFWSEGRPKVIRRGSTLFISLSIGSPGCNYSEETNMLNFREMSVK